MSADGIATLAVDDLGRSLMGWQLAGWQFQIPHDPLTVSFLEPGAAHVAVPQFEPIPTHAPETSPDTPEAADSRSAEISSGPVAPYVSQAASTLDTGDVPREALVGSGSSVVSGPANVAGDTVIPATADAGSAAAGGANLAGTPEPLHLLVEDIADVFEFNVIFQLNVLLDSDFIMQEAASASGASLFGPGLGQLAFTGGNTQSNSAAIMDAGGYGDFGWLAGDYYETNAVYSLNALDDGDIACNLISGTGLSSLQSITSGGNMQTNDAAIHSLTGGLGPVPEGVQIGPADTVEYNITAQINLMDDGDIVGQQIAGGDSGTQTASTGGNSQSNTALLVDDNAAPVYDVPGNYYESNLIIQANFMDDGDHVAQFAAADLADPQMRDTGLTVDDEALPHGLYGDALA